MELNFEVTMSILKYVALQWRCRRGKEGRGKGKRKTNGKKERVTGNRKRRKGNGGKGKGDV
jgi:hypothetical protein